MRPELESARRDWEDAYRRLENAVKDPSRQERLLLELEIVTEELRKRIGSRFALWELAAEYRRADDWAREAIAERAPELRGTATLAVAEGAAFHLYSRGATDYEP